MTLSIETAYEMFCASKKPGGYFYIDAICYCLFEHYDEGVAGYDQREQLRRKRPSIYEDLENITCLDDFAGIIARLKIEGY